LAESVNTQLIGVMGRLLISKLPFPKPDSQQLDPPESEEAEQSLHATSAIENLFSAQ